MGSPYQNDGMLHARDVCEEICDMGFWFLVMMGQTLLMSPKGRNASRDGIIKLWEGDFYYLQYYYFVK